MVSPSARSSVPTPRPELTGTAPSTRRIRKTIPCADDEEYVGLVDDVDRIQGELVKQTATVNCHVPSARREVVEVAVTMDEPAQCAAVPGARGARQ